MSNENERNSSYPNQLYGELLEINQQQKEMLALVRYLHSYVWEVHDPRVYEDILLGNKSTVWDKTFKAKESDAIVSTLWRRERDYDEGFR